MNKGFNLQAAQIFDRIIQVLECNRENYRKIQLSEPREKTICVQGLARAGSTLMRKALEEVDQSKLTAKDDETVLNTIGVNSIVQSGVSPAQHILALLGRVVCKHVHGQDARKAQGATPAPVGRSCRSRCGM